MSILFKSLSLDTQQPQLGAAGWVRCRWALPSLGEGGLSPLGGGEEGVYWWGPSPCVLRRGLRASCKSGCGRSPPLLVGSDPLPLSYWTRGHAHPPRPRQWDGDGVSGPCPGSSPSGRSGGTHSTIVMRCHTLKVAQDTMQTPKKQGG